jgi:hypothetical protein
MSTLIHALVNLILLPYQIMFHVFGGLLGGMATILAIPFQLFGAVIGIVFHFVIVGMQLIMLVLMAAILAAICIGGLLAYGRFFNQDTPRYVSREERGSDEDSFQTHSFSFRHPFDFHLSHSGDDHRSAMNGPTIVRTSEQSRSHDDDSDRDHPSISESRSLVILDGKVRSSNTIIHANKHGRKTVMTVSGEVDSDNEVTVGDDSDPKDMIASEETVEECTTNECVEPTSPESTEVATVAVAESERPAWVDEQEDHLHDGTHRVRAECGPCESPKECRRELPLRVREATHKYVLEQVHAWIKPSPFSDWVARQWTTDALRRRKIEPSRTFADVHEVKLEEVTSTSHFLYGLLEFDAEFRDRLRRDMQSYVRSARLGTYWCSAILGVAGLAVWFRGSSAAKSLDTAPKRFVARSGAGLIWIAAGVLSIASITWIPWL